MRSLMASLLENLCDPHRTPKSDIITVVRSCGACRCIQSHHAPQIRRESLACLASAFPRDPRAQVDCSARPRRMYSFGLPKMKFSSVTYLHGREYRRISVASRAVLLKLSLHDWHAELRRAISALSFPECLLAFSQPVSASAGSEFCHFIGLHQNRA
jgi:hypothetical protein